MSISEEFKYRREIVQNLKVQWKKMWADSVNDSWKAEGIANQDFPSLFVDKGTVLRATRDFKTLSFREIIEMHQIPSLTCYISPDPEIGGWRKFVKTHITSTRKQNSCTILSFPKIKNKEQQLKKSGGRGWLHK